MAMTNEPDVTRPGDALSFARRRAQPCFLFFFIPASERERPFAFPAFDLAFQASRREPLPKEGHAMLQKSIGGQCLPELFRGTMGCAVELV